MITKKNLNELYKWASNRQFPMKGDLTSPDYTNKTIYSCQLKFVRKNVHIRKKLMNDKVYEIYKNDEILNSMYSISLGGTILRPHKDPDIYTHRYKRIQIPTKVPDGCYFIWDGNKVTWEEGVPQCYHVMDFVHEAHVLCDETLEFLFVDVKVETEVEL
tara:strand:+ start:3570 stop:4046 length:477 start_codon:yes stop_codon:yes gene_type:complete